MNKASEKLENAGAIVSMTPVYQNQIPFENKELIFDVLNRQTIDWITFTSSSTATNFFKIIGKTLTQRELPKIASIGSITTKTLNQLQLSPAFSADPQNIEGLCQGIVNWEEQNRSR